MTSETSTIFTGSTTVTSTVTVDSRTLTAECAKYTSFKLYGYDPLDRLKGRFLESRPDPGNSLYLDDNNGVDFVLETHTGNLTDGTNQVFVRVFLTEGVYRLAEAVPLSPGMVDWTYAPLSCLMGDQATLNCTTSASGYVWDTPQIRDSVLLIGMDGYLASDSTYVNFDVVST